MHDIDVIICIMSREINARRRGFEVLVNVGRKSWGEVEERMHRVTG